jgi:ribulose-5-phosphate 4-epimerase/fuculose-1-phosphate aldolase
MDERAVRRTLAALYRIIDMCGWTDFIYTHVSARIPGTDYILLNKFGLLYEEICASNLIKVSLSTLDSSEVNAVGYNIHSAIHNARPSVNYVIHTHIPDIVAVSSQQSGLLPITQHSLFVINSLSYHDYEGIVYQEDEGQLMANDLSTNKCMLLKNHGSIVVGDTVESAFFHQYMLTAACTAQVKAQSNNINLVSNDTINRTLAYNGSSANVPRQHSSPMLWEAMIRKLNKLNTDYDK